MVLIALLLADLEGFKSSYRSRKLKATLETEPLYQGYWYLLAKKVRHAQHDQKAV